MRMNRGPEHLVKITVVQPSVPSYVQELSAHKALEVFRVKCGDEIFHIFNEPAGPDKKVPEPSYRHVRKREQAVECYAVIPLQLSSVIFFQRLLRGRQRWA